MKRVWLFFGLVLIVALLSGPSSYAVTIWDESVSGDLSNNNNVPTDLGTLNLGSNQIFGSLDGSYPEKDVAKFVVPDGFVLSQFILATYDYGTYYDYSPVALNTGSVVNYADSIEFILLTNWNAGTDLLQFDSAPGPQPSGVYTFYIGHKENDFSDEITPYSMVLNVAAVPEPSTMLLLGLGLMGLAGIRRKFQK